MSGSESLTMFTKMNAEAVPLTRELAQTHATLAPLPGERELKPSRLNYLLTQIKDGRFVGADWAVGKERSSGEVYRLDGQHSSYLLANLPVEIPLPSTLVTITTYEFDHVEIDADGLFNLFNNPASVRSNEDIMGLYRASHAELSALSRRLLIKITNGIANYEKDRLDRGAKDARVWLPRKRGNYFTNPRYIDIALWMATFQGTKNDDFLAKPPIVAEMIEHKLTNPAVADQFWLYVFTEGHPEPDDITRTLADTYRTWLQTQKKHKPEQYRQKAAIAWKHYVRELKAVAA